MNRYPTVRNTADVALREGVERRKVSDLDHSKWEVG
jgi:hypothetical protein